ncbi:IclR family transcriptional regulator C-terminal domain-containing protein [Agromyces sp. H66]|uniref:IclR family transcriptional regulator domain-containing protein n=1 Tax=Agromyces sp. H66 TaxID=2529859 RepID=UPI0024A76D33|nr:IclR family transcriptional regulator C-terminal domain-containing protein [Agromyces sp. H66]
MATERSRDRIQSIERGVEVLRAFGERDATLSVAEIATRVNLSRPVVRRILLTFEHLGYAVAQSGQWRLTPRILELGAGYFQRSSLPEVAYPYMADVVETTGETCSAGVLDGTEVIHVARVEDRRPLPDAIRIGTRLPAHATAVGKVLLADLAERDLKRYLKKARLEQHTPHTITDPEVLGERLTLVRERGYDVSMEELHPGQVAVAVPIVVDGRAVGGLTASSTTVRESESSLRETVMPVLQRAAEGIAGAYRNANPQIFRSR